MLAPKSALRSQGRHESLGRLTSSRAKSSPNGPQRSAIGPGPIGPSCSTCRVIAHMRSAARVQSHARKGSLACSRQPRVRPPMPPSRCEHARSLGAGRRRCSVAWLARGLAGAQQRASRASRAGLASSSQAAISWAEVPRAPRSSPAYIMSSTSIAHSAFASCSALTTGPTQAEQEGSAPGPTHRPPMPRVGACESVRRSTSSSAFAIDRRGSMSLVASRVTVVVTRPKVDSPRWGSGRQLWWSRYAFRYTLDLVVR